LDKEVMLNLMVELAGLEEELASVRATLAHHVARDRHLRELQEEYTEDVTREEGDSREATLSVRSAEGRIRDLEAALARKRDQLIGVTDRRQFQALQSEIRNLENELDRLETEAIELMEAAGRKTRRTEKAERERNAQADKGSAELARLDKEATQARLAEREISEEIERLLGMLPEATARHVARLRSQDGPAVVRVQGGACGGCFSRLPTQQGLDAAKGRALVRCASCSRFVVRQSWK
jgi:predicted  nucleic acid-binding Zn-ribbon protein